MEKGIIYTPWIIANNGIDIHYADGSFVEVATACNKGFAEQIINEHSANRQLQEENKVLKEEMQLMDISADIIIKELKAKIKVLQEAIKTVFASDGPMNGEDIETLTKALNK